jgi:hypothetical protein
MTENAPTDPDELPSGSGQGSGSEGDTTSGGSPQPPDSDK